MPRYQRLEQEIFTDTFDSRIRVCELAIEDGYEDVALQKIDYLRNQIGNLFYDQDAHRKALSVFKKKLTPLIEIFSDSELANKVRQIIESLPDA